MRFVLDEDVDASVVRVLFDAGHDGWTIQNAGLGAVPDEVVAVYGHEQDAVVVTHDEEFSRWRKKNCVGKHLFLRCEEPDAAELIEKNLADIVPVMERYTDLYAQLSQSTLTFTWQWD
ncbi:hypothetical protein GCM10009737_10940 [Nocardioides lentus]|uniref:DUF5615 domain-containing protein n=1 Tax=Nocardioides lentus TaxID=338077 RepID=A0ABN2P5Y6_9ACTN